VLHDERRVLPVSSLLTSYRPLNKPDAESIKDICLSVPAIITANGVEQPLEIPMNDAEWAGLQRSAETIRNAIRAVGF